MDAQLVIDFAVACLELEDDNHVDVKPYSHNIIALMLEMVSNEYGQERANKLIVDLELEELGWQVVE